MRDRTNFIPKPYKKLNVSFRLEVEKIELVDQLAATYNVSRSEFLAQCVDFAIEHMPKEEDNE